VIGPRQIGSVSARIKLSAASRKIGFSNATRAKHATVPVMTPEQIIGLALALMIMLVGLFGCVLPGVPGTPLILAVAVGHWLYFDPASVTLNGLLLLVSLTLLSLLLDYLATMLGAQKLGASWRGVVGAVVGATLGLFFTIPGIILGPFLGALIFEMLGGRPFEEAARAGMGAVLGLLVGAVGKLASGVAMIVLFLVYVVSRSGTAV